MFSGIPSSDMLLVYCLQYTVAYYLSRFLWHPRRKGRGLIQNPTPHRIIFSSPKILSPIPLMKFPAGTELAGFIPSLQTSSFINDIFVSENSAFPHTRLISFFPVNAVNVWCGLLLIWCAITFTPPPVSWASALIKREYLKSVVSER